MIKVIHSDNKYNYVILTDEINNRSLTVVVYVLNKNTKIELGAKFEKVLAVNINKEVLDDQNVLNRKIIKYLSLL